MLRLFLIAGLAMLTGAVAPQRAVAQTSGQIKCESWNYQQARCPVDNIVSADLDTVTGGQCTQGRSWGWDRGGIWVSGGCRGRFSYRTGYPGGGYPGGGNSGGGAIVKCESWNYQPARCATNTNGGVMLSRRIAGNCQEGQTWGWDRGSIWVSGGCRAEFRVGYNGGGGYPGGGYPNGGQSFEIKCESWNYQPARCPATIRTGVRISKALGGECILNRSWGWDRGGIWVKNGCRAMFRVDG